jgi:hypothetical protein
MGVYKMEKTSFVIGLNNIGVKWAELSQESNKKVYTYRISNIGDIIALVNFNVVDVLPVTKLTRKLSIDLDHVWSEIVRMLCIDSTSEEYKKLFWMVKATLEK